MVDINPGTGVYAMFPSFNYKLWGAIAEFVDNSVSSYQSNRDRLRELHSNNFRLIVHIDYDDAASTLTVRDNAAGIAVKDYGRAFRLAIPPSDLSHISQYGVGMKAAACWFAKTWTVTSSAMGEAVVRTVDWNTPEIVEGNIESLDPLEQPAEESDHYTVVRLTNLYRSIRGQSVGKVKTYIAGIYREFIRSGEVEIFFNGERLTPTNHAILRAPKWNDESGLEIDWDRHFEINLTDKIKVRGRAFLLSTMKRPETALNLFWHGRLIRGNAEPNYRPTEIFGAINSFESGRLCIDLHLDEFQPTVEKQDFLFERNGISEEDLLSALRQELSHADFDILGQARNFRSGRMEDRQTVVDIVREVVQQATSPILETINNPLAPTPTAPYPPITPLRNSIAEQLISFSIGDCPWEFSFRIDDGPDAVHMIDITERVRLTDDEPERLDIAVAYSHPFIKKFWSDETQQLIVAFSLALGFGEVAARRGGAMLPSQVRSNMDKILRNLVAHQAVGSTGRSN